MEVSNTVFIVGAYSVTWIVILGYLVRLTLKGRRARAAYERLAPGQGREIQP